MQSELILFNGHLAGRSESSINTSMLTLSTPGGGRAACDSDLVILRQGPQRSPQQPVTSQGVFSLERGWPQLEISDALGTMQFSDHYDICLYTLGY